MVRNESVAELLARFQSQLRHHREQEALHAEREAFHREQRTRHAAELEALSRHFEALQAAVDAAGTLPGVELAPAAPPAVPVAEPPVALAYGRGRRPPIMPAVKKAVDAQAPDEPFGAHAVTAEVNRRFADQLRGGVEERHVEGCLRRLARDGYIVRVTKGRPHHEARYTRSRPPKAS
ncbi:MAG TPA: hypothetical protein VGG03_13735 [Thermoanaerobaculia bacterium]|jgi:hypothetical protein